MPNKLVGVDEDPDSKYYVINGEPYTRVTLILEVIHNEGLEFWKRKEGANAKVILKEASEFGKRVHTIVEGINLDPRGYKCQDRELIEYYDAYRDFYNSYVQETVATELRVHSELHRYAGKFDMLLRLKPNVRIPTGGGSFYETPNYPQLFMADAKTNRTAVSAKTRLQTCGYIEAGREMDEWWADEVEGRMAIWLPSSEPGYILPIIFNDPQRDQDAWVATRTMYRWNELHKNDFKRGKPKL